VAKKKPQPARFKVAVERQPEEITIKAERDTTWVVVVRPVGITRRVGLEAHCEKGGHIEAVALAGLVAVKSATCADGTEVGMTDDRPATDPTTWPAMVGAFYRLAVQIKLKAIALAEVEEERGNSSPAPA
jgi:hypothetical protein